MGHPTGQLADGFDLLRLAQLLLTPAQRKFGLPSLGNVAKDENDPDRPSVGIPDRSAARFNRSFRSLQRQQYSMVRDTDGQAFSENPRNDVFDRLPCLLIDNIEGLVKEPAFRICFSPPGQGLSNGIHGDDPALMV